MISDKLEHLILYQSLFKDGFLAFLKPILFSYLHEDKPASSEYVYTGTKFFIYRYEYPLKEPSSCTIESHLKYIDLQLTIHGCEGIDVFYKSDQTLPCSIDKPNDFLVYREEEITKFSTLFLSRSYFTILFPTDLHRPQVKVTPSESTNKLVVKIPLSLLTPNV
jgi:YhcH/YjgK/YiaL family protein